MTAERKTPEAASGELAPEDLDQVVGGKSYAKGDSQGLSRQEASRKLSDDPATLSKNEEGEKRTRG